MYLNIVRHLIFQYLCFFLATIKTGFVLCFNLFLLPSLNCLFLCFYIAFDFNIFWPILGLKLPFKEHLSMLQRLSEWKYEIFLGTSSLHPTPLDTQLPFNGWFVKNIGPNAALVTPLIWDNIGKGFDCLICFSILKNQQHPSYLKRLIKF